MKKNLFQPIRISLILLIIVKTIFHKRIQFLIDLLFFSYQTLIDNNTENRLFLKCTRIIRLLPKY